MDQRLKQRLSNWGDWLLYSANAGPDKARCTSIESTHIPDADEVWEASEIYPVPNVSDAEAIEATLMQLYKDGRIGVMERYCLAVRYAGYAAVFRVRRLGEHALEKLADNAEMELYEYMRKSA